MDLLVRSCPVRPIMCRRERKSTRFCLIKHKYNCELPDSKTKSKTIDKESVNIHEL